MASYSGSTRWWENYLVRYFLPSIAGMFIIAWLGHNTNGALLPYLPTSNSNLTPAQLDWTSFGTSNLIIWILFGTLYCYLASYPCLVFHATRALDFKDVTGNPTRLWLNPYLTSIAFVTAACLSAKSQCLVTAFVVVTIYSVIQIIRLYLAYVTQADYGFNKLGAKTSIAYAYLSKLSQQRSILEVQEEENDGVKTTHNQKQDLADSYRHLREHGNTAFIYLLEIGLCPIVWVILSQGKDDGMMLLACILVIWVIPSVFVHWFGQHLERRYSLFKH